jgi:trimethylamine--corrinoid protein Co-methyltransferase
MRRQTALTRAHEICNKLLSAYEAPPLDPAVDEALRAYVEKRKREGGAPVN